MRGEKLHQAVILAAPLAFTFATAIAVQAQDYSPNPVAGLIDEDASFGFSGVIHSFTPDADNGEIISFNFGQLQSNGRPPSPSDPRVIFDNTYSGPGLNLSAFADSDVFITLLPGSADSSVEVVPFIQGGASSNFAFFEFTQPGAELIVTDHSEPDSTSVFADNPVNGFTAAGTDNIRWGFEVFPVPNPDAPQPFGTGPDFLEIDGDFLPEPASVSLLAITFSALLVRRRRYVKTLHDSGEMDSEK
jgi:hypothetical protein